MLEWSMKKGVRGPGYLQKRTGYSRRSFSYGMLLNSNRIRRFLSSDASVGACSDSRLLFDCRSWHECRYCVHSAQCIFHALPEETWAPSGPSAMVKKSESRSRSFQLARFITSSTSLTGTANDLRLMAFWNTKPPEIRVSNCFHHFL